MRTLVQILNVPFAATGNSTRRPLNASGFYLQLLAYRFSLRPPQRLARLLCIGTVELHLQGRL